MSKVQVLVRGHKRRIDIDNIVREVRSKSPSVRIDVQPMKGAFDYRFSIDAPSDADLNDVLARMKKTPGVKSMSTFASE